MRYKLRFFQQNVDMYMRTESGDILMFYEIFWSKMYEIPQCLLNNPKWIIDLGANVGFTTLYFALKYNDVKIVSVEPSKLNYKILQQNTSSYKNIIALNAAVWNEHTTISFAESPNAFNSKVSEAENETSYNVDAINVSEILEQEKIDEVDLIKIDIEGAEQNILQQNNEWLRKVNSIIIELHTPYSAKDFQRDLSPFGFTIIAPPNEGLKMIFATKKLSQP